ncbi:MAG: hypothetical protein SFT91_03255 [Rickettsiaceae bacterium]|nr:hypothetical protein [Rickettsiaceae bacterium]
MYKFISVIYKQKENLCPKKAKIFKKKTYQPIQQNKGNNAQQNNESKTELKIESPFIPNQAEESKTQVPEQHIASFLLEEEKAPNPPQIDLGKEDDISNKIQEEQNLEVKIEITPAFDRENTLAPISENDQQEEERDHDFEILEFSVNTPGEAAEDLSSLQLEIKVLSQAIYPETAQEEIDEDISAIVENFLKNRVTSPCENVFSILRSADEIKIFYN